MAEQFEKIEQYGLEDEFTNSIKDFYIKNNRITERQKACLEYRIERYEKIRDMIDEIDKKEILKMELLFTDLKRFFKDKHYLSNKQLDLLKRMIS